jgi:Mn-dependent DtxR family transcriptional regulator
MATAKKTEKQERGSLTEENAIFMIDNWGKVTIDEMATKFGVKNTTVLNAAARLRKMSGGKVCPNKRAKKTDMFAKILASRGIEVTQDKK